MITVTKKVFFTRGAQGRRRIVDKPPPTQTVPEGRIVACEPNPILAQTYLPQNLALNGFYNGVEICPRSWATSTTRQWNSC